MKVMKSVSTFTWQWPVIAVLLFIHSSFEQCLTKEDSRLFTNPTGHQALYKGQHDFSLSLLREINKGAPTDNIFFSPYSTYHALLLAYFISASQTEKFVHQALRLDANQDKVDVMQAYRFDKLRRRMAAADKSYEFDSASKIYVTTEATIRDCIEDLFKEEIEKTDFAHNPTTALQNINSWVDEQTQGMIKDFLPADAIDSTTNLVLVNAAFFKGMWEYKFDPLMTQKMVFYISPSENTYVDMMTQEGTFNHDVSESLGAHILELPYKGGSASMFILLPPFSAGNGVENVLSNLNSNSFHNIADDGSLDAKTVIVSLPRFALEREIELKGILENLGVGDLLTEQADLSTLTGAKNVSLGSGIHKARIEVTEEGTKAAAATALFTFRSSRPAEPAQFICNHPFIYVIYDKPSKAILFTGIFRRPT